MNLYQPTITGSLSVSGSVNISGSISIAGGGTISGTASIATTALTASFVANAQTASYVLNAVSSSFALTASSADNLLVRNTLTAQTLVVQTITSSVDFVTGSTRFGSISANTHQFTGSVSITGSLAVVTTGTELQVNANGVNLGNALTDSHIISGSLTVNPGGLFVSGSGNVGINTTSPSSKLHVVGSSLTDTFRITDAANYTIVMGYSGSANVGMISTLGGTAKLALGTNSAARLTIDGTGNVGIGTVSPSEKLHITSTAGNVASLVETAGGSFAQYQLKGGATNVWIIGTQDNYLSNSLVFRNVSDRMVITTGGNVLIDTTSNATGNPTFYIQNKNGLVANIAGFNFCSTTTAENGNNNLVLSGAYYNGTVGIATQTSAASYQQFNGNHAFYTNEGLTPGNSYTGSERIRITSTGNVGIGTGNPLGPLEVRAANRLVSNDGILQINTTNSQAADLGGSLSFGGRWEAGATPTEWAQISGRKENSNINEYGGYLSFATRPHGGVNTERIRITSAGVVSINSSGGEANAGLDRFTMGYFVSNYGWMQTWASTPLYLNRLGNNVSAFGSAGFGLITTTSSDVRIKKNIVSIESALDKVNALRGVYFEFDKNNELEVSVPHGKTRVGLIAQEVETIIPEAVIDGDNDGTPKSVDYTGLVGVLVKAIQELKAEFDEYKTTHP
jgi:hypothetical protein